MYAVIGVMFNSGREEGYETRSRERINVDNPCCPGQNGSVLIYCKFCEILQIVGLHVFLDLLPLLDLHIKQNC